MVEGAQSGMFSGNLSNYLQSLTSFLPCLSFREQDDLGAFFNREAFKQVVPRGLSEIGPVSANNALDRLPLKEQFKVLAWSILLISPHPFIQGPTKDTVHNDDGGRRNDLSRILEHVCVLRKDLAESCKGATESVQNCIPIFYLLAYGLVEDVQQLDSVFEKRLNDHPIELGKGSRDKQTKLNDDEMLKGVAQAILTMTKIMSDHTTALDVYTVFKPLLEKSKLMSRQGKSIQKLFLNCIELALKDKRELRQIIPFLRCILKESDTQMKQDLLLMTAQHLKTIRLVLPSQHDMSLESYFEDGLAFAQELSRFEEQAKGLSQLASTMMPAQKWVEFSRSKQTKKGPFQVKSKPKLGNNLEKKLLLPQRGQVNRVGASNGKPDAVSKDCLFDACRQIRQCMTDHLTQLLSNQTGRTTLDVLSFSLKQYQKIETAFLGAGLGRESSSARLDLMQLRMMILTRLSKLSKQDVKTLGIERVFPFLESTMQHVKRAPGDVETSVLMVLKTVSSQGKLKKVADFLMKHRGVLLKGARPEGQFILGELTSICYKSISKETGDQAERCQVLEEMMSSLVKGALKPPSDDKTNLKLIGSYQTFLSYVPHDPKQAANRRSVLKEGINYLKEQLKKFKRANQLNRNGSHNSDAKIVRDMAKTVSGSLSLFLKLGSDENDVITGFNDIQSLLSLLNLEDRKWLRTDEVKSVLTSSLALIRDKKVKDKAIEMVFDVMEKLFYYSNEFRYQCSKQEFMDVLLSLGENTAIGKNPTVFVRYLDLMSDILNVASYYNAPYRCDSRPAFELLTHAFLRLREILKSHKHDSDKKKSLESLEKSYCTFVKKFASKNANNAYLIAAVSPVKKYIKESAMAAHFRLEDIFKPLLDEAEPVYLSANTEVFSLQFADVEKISALLDGTEIREKNQIDTGHVLIGRKQPNGSLARHSVISDSKKYDLVLNREGLLYLLNNEMKDPLTREPIKADAYVRLMTDPTHEDSQRVLSESDGEGKKPKRLNSVASLSTMATLNGQSRENLLRDD